MRRYLFCSVFLAALLSCGKDSENPITETPTGPGNDPYAVDLPNGNFESGLEGWTRKDYANGENAVFEIAEGQGTNGSKCLKIQQFPENGVCCVAAERKLTGLEPDQMYRVSARVRYSDVPNDEGTGPVLFSPNTNQYWNSSKYLYGTELKSWTTVSCDFLTDDWGNATISVALGFWQGGLANGGRSTGTAYFDNITVKKVSDELFTLKGEHVRLYIDPAKVIISTDLLSQWLDRLDMMYESYEELMGGTPYNGRNLAILTTRGIYSGYWALAGYPILWSSNYTAVEDSFGQMADYDDWCFGLLHELGHVFNIGNSGWNWNDEMFANFRMSYALEACGGTVIMRDTKYTGAEIMDYYKIFYDETIGSGIAKNNGDALHYTFLRIKEKYGWDIFKTAFRELYAADPSTMKDLRGDYEKMLFFLKYVSDAAGEDVIKTCYTPQEMKLIEQSLS